MTFMLILGAAASLYLIWLLFRLAALALPLGTGIALAFEKIVARQAFIVRQGERKLAWLPSRHHAPRPSGGSIPLM